MTKHSRTMLTLSVCFNFLNFKLNQFQYIDYCFCSFVSTTKLMNLFKKWKNLEPPCISKTISTGHDQFWPLLLSQKKSSRKWCQNVINYYGIHVSHNENQTPGIVIIIMKKFFNVTGNYLKNFVACLKLFYNGSIWKNA